MCGMDKELPNEFDPRRVLPIVPGVFSKEMVLADSVVPIGFDDDGCLIIAAPEPCEEEVLDKARFVANREIKVVLVSDEAMAYAVQRYVLFGKPDFDITGKTPADYLRWLEGLDEGRSGNPE